MAKYGMHYLPSFFSIKLIRIRLKRDLKIKMLRTKKKLFQFLLQIFPGKLLIDKYHCLRDISLKNTRALVF